MWNGFYAGLDAGYGFGTNGNTQSVSIGELAYDSDYSYSLVQTGPILIPTGIGLALSGVGSQKQNGFIGGGQIGYNYQYGSNVILGIEVDMQGAGIRALSGVRGIGGGNGADNGPIGTYSSNFTSVGGSRINAGVDWMGTVRGRLGYLWTPTMLVYATGGLTYGGAYASVSSYAVTSNDWSDNNIVLPAASGSATKTYVGGGTKLQTLVGWNVGGGLEWMFMPNWSLKAEGVYWNMGNMNVSTATFAAAPTFNGDPFWENQPSMTIGGTRVNFQGVIVRGGVNYHFNFGGSAPTAASY
jgi:outer membrane immunogenic protein